MTMPSLRSGTRQAYGIAAALIACLLGVGVSWAQSPAPPTDTKSQAVPVLVTEAPYSEWKHHTVTKPEDAVVLIRYVPISGGAEVTTTGLVARCDGFILAPSAVRDAARAGNPVRAVVTPVDTGAEAKPTTIAVPVIPHPGTHASVPYAPVKTNGYHISCLPLLDPANVRTGISVRVLTAVPASGTNAFSVGAHRARVAQVGSESDRDICTLTMEEAGDIPSGSIVVDDASGAAVGMVTAGGATPTFTDFGKLYVVASDLALAPDRGAVRLGDTPDKATPPNMIWVAGGAVRLRGYAQDTFSKAFHTDIVCTPGFYVDTYPVTTRQFNAWMHGHPDEDTTPRDKEDMPATGMTQKQIEHYVADHGMRLMTQAEWARASYVADASWAEGKDRAWNEATLRIYQSIIRASEQAAADKNAKEVSQFAGITKVNGVAVATPVIVPNTGQWNDLFQSVSAALRQEKWPWRYVHPIGLFVEDRSAFEVRDVVTNPVEYLQRDAAGAIYADKYAPAEVDQSRLRMNSYSIVVLLVGGSDKNGHAIGATGFGQSRGMPGLYSEAIRLLMWHDGWAEERKISDIFDAGTIRAETGLLEIHSYAYAPLVPGGTGVYAEGENIAGQIGVSPDDNAHGLALSTVDVVARSKAEPTFRCAR